MRYFHFFGLIFDACFLRGRWEELTADANLELPYLRRAIVEFQNPAEADKLTKIQRDLEQTTEVLHQTIDSVLVWSVAFILLSALMCNLYVFVLCVGARS